MRASNDTLLIQTILHNCFKKMSAVSNGKIDIFSMFHKMVPFVEWRQGSVLGCFEAYESQASRCFGAKRLRESVRPSVEYRIPYFYLQ